MSRVLLERAGWTETELTEDSDVPLQAEPVFIDAACAALNDPLFAARAGLMLKDGAALSSYIAKHSMTLRKAIDNSARYYAAFDPAFEYGVAPSGNAASFTLNCIDPDFGHFHRHLEFLTFAALERGRVLTGSDYRPLELRFAHRVAHNVKKMEKLAGCPVRFGMERTEILLPLWVLDAPIPTYDPKLRSYLMAYGDRVLAETPAVRQTMRQKVKAVLAQNLPGRLLSAAETAEALGMSNRTFARRLADEGLSFRTVADILRRDLAMAYLTDGFAIAEIAFVLGYADQAAFSTAFKRWTGTSPAAWRTDGAPPAE
jgi:AraC-like DNA-binding protein